MKNSSRTIHRELEQIDLPISPDDLNEFKSTNINISPPN